MGSRFNVIWIIKWFSSNLGKGQRWSNYIYRKIEKIRKNRIELSKKTQVKKKILLYSELAINLFNELCDIKPSKRYNCDESLKHPWITRDTKGKIPLKLF